VAASKRSVLYSMTIRVPSPAAATPPAMDRVRSNGAIPERTPPSGVSGASVSPGSSRGGAAVARFSITWKSGVWLRLRRGFRSSTSSSNGRSWWAWAASTVSRVRSSRPPSVGRPARLPRRTRVLTKKPISRSVSRRLRPANGVPMTISGSPLRRPRSAWKAVR